MNYLNKIKKFITMPKDYELVSKNSEVRNRKNVEILRFQKRGIFILNGPRIIIILLDDEIISIKNLITIPQGKFPNSTEAKETTKQVFSIANDHYSRDLTFIRIEKQQRSFLDEHHQSHVFPVIWIKYVHTNGSYSWVTLGADHTVIEMEFDSHWDYFKGRRKTEMWDNDDWVLAHEGKGPQLSSPNALA